MCSALCVCCHLFNVYNMQFQDDAGGGVVVAKHYHAGAGLSVLLTIVSVFSLFRGSLR